MNGRSAFPLALPLALCALALATLLILGAGPVQALATVRFVAADGLDSGACTNPASPCQTVQYAVDAANEGDIVRVAAGVYHGVHGRRAPYGYQGPAMVTQTVYLSKTLAIRGGYTTTNNFAGPPDPDANPSTLDAGGEGRVLFIAGDVSPLIYGLRITGGDATGLGGDLYQATVGGGIYVLTATARINGNQVFGNSAGPDGSGAGAFVGYSDSILRGNTFSENSADLDGGGLYLSYSGATLQDNVFAHNTANRFGGGLHMWYSPVMVEGNEFRDNEASYGAGLQVGGVNGGTFRNNSVVSNDALVGGGMYLQYAGWISPTRFISNTIAENSAAWGGGLFLIYAPVSFAGNEIVDNAADRGGGLDALSSEALFERNTFARNAAEGEGGGVRMETSLPTFNGNRFEQNSAGDGGGLHLWVSTAAMDGNTFLANSAGQGGGLHLLECDGTLANNIFAANQATGTGSGLYLAGSAPRLVHTTLAGNYGGDGTGIYVTNWQSYPSSPSLTDTILVSHTTGIFVESGSSASLEATLWGNATDWAGGGAIDTGAINQWGNPAFIDPLAGDFHIGPGSVAVDAGIDGGVAVDIDGDPRPMGGGFEMGADEVPAAGQLHVDDIRMRYLDRGGGRFAVDGLARIHDQDGQPVAGALVWVVWTLPDGAELQQASSTDDKGLARLRLRSRQTGEYMLCVSDVSMPGYAYDPDQNVETCDELVIP